LSISDFYNELQVFLINKSIGALRGKQTLKSRIKRRRADVDIAGSQAKMRRDWEEGI
jgi:hypothetical protein